jgi:hypothetical protein
MIVLLDRGLSSNTLLDEVAGTGSAFLARPMRPAANPRCCAGCPTARSCRGRGEPGQFGLADGPLACSTAAVLRLCGARLRESGQYPGLLGRVTYRGGSHLDLTGEAPGPVGVACLGCRLHEVG